MAFIHTLRPRHWPPRLYLVLALAACLLAGEGCRVQKQGRRQPTHGPIPCPIKDC